MIGSKKPGDFTSEAILRGYRTYIRHYLPKNRVLFTPLLTYSRYAGPKEAIFTALVRRNFGCTHFIIGRDHTGVQTFYPPYASQEIFRRFPDLGITPLFFQEPYFCTHCNEVTTEKTCPHAASLSKKEIGGGVIRGILAKHTQIDPSLIRPEVATALRKVKPLFCG